MPGAGARVKLSPAYCYSSLTPPPTWFLFAAHAKPSSSHGLIPVATVVQRVAHPPTSDHWSSQAPVCSDLCASFLQACGLKSGRLSRDWFLLLLTTRGVQCPAVPTGKAFFIQPSRWKLHVGGGGDSSALAFCRLCSLVLCSGLEHLLFYRGTQTCLILEILGWGTCEASLQ